MLARNPDFERLGTTAKVQRRIELQRLTVDPDRNRRVGTDLDLARGQLSPAGRPLTARRRRVKVNDPEDARIQSRASSEPNVGPSR
jgi:hypothetical protein